LAHQKLMEAATRRAPVRQCGSTGSIFAHSESLSHVNCRFAIFASLNRRP
jgi:hypothetical protein